MSHYKRHKHPRFRKYHYDRLSLESLVAILVRGRLKRLLAPGNLPFLVLSFILFVFLAVTGLVEIYRSLPAHGWLAAAWAEVQGFSIIGVVDRVITSLTSITLGSLVAFVGQVLHYFWEIIVALTNVLVGFVLLGAALIFRLAGTRTGKIASWILWCGSLVSAIWTYLW